MVQKLRQAKLPVAEVSKLTKASEHTIHRIQHEPEVEDIEDCIIVAWSIQSQPPRLDKPSRCIFSNRRL